MTTTLTGSEGTGQAPAPETSGNPAAESQTGTKSWHDSLPDDLKADAALTKFKDVPDLAKAYKHAQALIGKKGVILPGEKASDEEWAYFYKSLGQPELEKYELQGPKDKKVNPEAVSKFKEAAHKAGLLPKQAEKLLEFYTAQEGEALAQRTQAKQAEAKQNLESLKKEWGQGWDKNVELARLAVKEVGGPEFAQYLETSGLGDDTRLISVMAKVGKLLGEDKIRGEGGGRMDGKTPAEIEAEIGDIMGNPKHPYFDQSHPGHKGAVAMVESLFRMKAK